MAWRWPVSNYESQVVTDRPQSVVRLTWPADRRTLVGRDIASHPADVYSQNFDWIEAARLRHWSLDPFTKLNQNNWHFKIFDNTMIETAMQNIALAGVMGKVIFLQWFFGNSQWKLIRLTWCPNPDYTSVVQSSNPWIFSLWCVLSFNPASCNATVMTQFLHDAKNASLNNFY